MDAEVDEFFGDLAVGEIAGRMHGIDGLDQALRQRRRLVMAPDDGMDFVGAAIEGLEHGEHVAVRADEIAREPGQADAGLALDGGWRRRLGVAESLIWSRAAR